MNNVNVIRMKIKIKKNVVFTNLKKIAFFNLF